MIYLSIIHLFSLSLCSCVFHNMFIGVPFMGLEEYQMKCLPLSISADTLVISDCQSFDTVRLSLSSI